MKAGPLSAAVAALLLGFSLDASEAKYTDARNDGLTGPIRSVSTRVQHAQIEWSQPDGPMVFLPVFCTECEYDAQGNRIKRGQIIDGEFQGEVIQILRDSAGSVIEKIGESPAGEIWLREVIGPYGITEQDNYKNGEQVSQFFWYYDANGHVSAFRSYDRDGVLVSSSISMNDPSGNFKEEWDYGANGSLSLHFVQINEPKTDTFTFKNFNEDGSVKLTFTTVGTKVAFYWQEPGEQNVFGSVFFIDPVRKVRDAYSCHADETCDHIIVHFADEEGLRPGRIERRDPAGLLELSADYEYELDAVGNWTKRTVWVWNPQLGERKLLETDFRTLTYWAR